MHDDSPNAEGAPPRETAGRQGHQRADGQWEFAPESGSDHEHDTWDLATDPTPFAGEPNPALGPTPAIPPDALARSRAALKVWLGILVVFGVGGILFGQQELALLIAVSGVIIVAHAADFHPRFELLYRTVSIALIGVCGSTLLALAAYFRMSPPAGIAGVIVFPLSLVSGLLMFATGAPPVGMALARAMFGAKGDSHSFRLAARLTLFGFLVAVPGWFAAQPMFERSQDMNALFENLSLGGAVLGYIILALAAVGFLVRRDLSSTIERLGLTRLGTRHLLISALGVPVLWGLNIAGEWGQQHWFPALAVSDRRINEALAGALDRRAMMGLALTAGIGEEITMRGALQPKLGLVLTSLFFAALHIQYSWYGMALIFALGMVLGLIRKHSNTTTAMAVHALYDLAALLAT